MAQRTIEILIGRLLTDEAYRATFLTDRCRALQVIREGGHDLTPVEIAALLATPPALWSEVADQIDPRLQKADLSRHQNGRPGNRAR